MALTLTALSNFRSGYSSSVEAQLEDKILGITISIPEVWFHEIGESNFKKLTLEEIEKQAIQVLKENEG
ncbi:hypothetical protein FE392_16630 [Xenorhabdus sp. 12]|uniref:Uncharacterized protein n=1 Tax=Xenorhabdus santafensis TaxID=2582833 RepID=A0ABU4SDP5_9GAMM|nr:hypothetical protein [Xenorhabdus sp. 12]MDX7988928.1 hypothetical protein [Xenorhabdus sp. 12]